KLTFDDKRYVLDHMMELRRGKEESPFKAKDDNPFQPKKLEEPEPPAAKQESDNVKIVSPDWSSAEAVAFMPEQAGWKFAVPLPAPEPPERKARVIVLPRRENFFEGCTALVANHTGRRVLIGYAWDFQRPQPQTRIVLCDMVHGKKLLAATATGKLTPMALNDNGSQVLMSGEKDHKPLVELWNPGWRERHDRIDRVDDRRRGEEDFVPRVRRFSLAGVHGARLRDVDRLCLPGQDRLAILGIEHPLLDSTEAGRNDRPGAPPQREIQLRLLSVGRVAEVADQTHGFARRLRHDPGDD
ncbi:MAG: hypothetical protein ABSH20_30635, partial [Tepidisphaeraceae bacterium]